MRKVTEKVQDFLCGKGQVTEEEAEEEAQKMDEKEHHEISEDHLGEIGSGKIVRNHGNLNGSKTFGLKVFAVYAALPSTPDSECLARNLVSGQSELALQLSVRSLQDFLLILQFLFLSSFYSTSVKWQPMEAMQYKSK